MPKVKIQVLDPDGKFRGKQRSSKIPSPSWRHGDAANGSPADVMACDGELDTGTWLLFSPEADHGKAVSSREQTPAQALAWFLTNGVEPPDQLIIRARRYWADWLHVRNVPEATAAFTALAQPKANAGGTASPPPSDDELATLRRLGLISCDDTLPPRATELVREMGLGQLSKWMDSQVMNIADWLKQNVGIQVAPNADASGPTTFSITNEWLESWETWHTSAHPFCDPPSVRHCATALAAATKSALAVLRRFGEPTDAAERLVVGLEGSEPQRTPRMDQTAWSLQRQMLRICHYISCGALSGDEDQRERVAEWQHRLDEFQTPEARATFQEAVDFDLSHPRSAERYVGMLNAARDLQAREPNEIQLTAILAKPVTDATSKCQRWQALVDYGRRFSLNDGRPNGVESVNFHTLVGAEKSYGPSPRPRLELRWANELKHATEALHALAHEADVDSSDRLAISELDHRLEQVLDGHEVDLRSATDKVRVLTVHIAAELRLPKDVSLVTPPPAPRYRRIQKAIDDAGFDLLCEAWDKSDPAHRKRPTWRKLAEAVQKALGLTTKLSSTMTDLKSRSPRTREKWDAIGREMAKEKAERVELRKK